jgi:mRNA interferase YafQ
MTPKKPASSKRAAPSVRQHQDFFQRLGTPLPLGPLRPEAPEGGDAAAHCQRCASLGPEWLDHPLRGDWADHRECHIGGDFLLIYRLDCNAILFVRAGTHAELFEEYVVGAESLPDPLNEISPNGPSACPGDGFPPELREPAGSNC